jgi:predicted Fe-Mo cluster-binding NifX family protein
VITTEEDRGLDSPLSAGFGKSPYYLVAKIENGEVVDLKTGKNRHFGGHQLGLMHSIRDCGVNVLLAKDMEPRVASMFNDLGIEARTDCSGSAKTAIQDYLESSPMRRNDWK